MPFELVPAPRIPPTPEESWRRLSTRKHDARWHQGRQQLIERAVARLRLPPSGLVLDVAGGDGFYSSIVASSTGGRLVTMDMSEDGSAAAYAAGHTAVRGDTLHLPFADHVADITVAFEILGYFGRVDAYRIIEELYRVTKPGGTLLLSTPNRYSLESWKGLARYLVDGSVWNAGGISYVTIYSRRALFSLLRHRFDVQACYGYYLIPAVRGVATPWTYSITTNPLLMTGCHKLLIVAKRR